MASDTMEVESGIILAHVPVAMSRKRLVPFLALALALVLWIAVILNGPN